MCSLNIQIKYLFKKMNLHLLQNHMSMSNNTNTIMSSRTEITGSSTVVNTTTSDSDERYCSEALEFAQSSISNMIDGDTITISVAKSNKINRIELHKGVTKVNESYEITNWFSLSSWKGLFLTLAFVIPWTFGAKHLGTVGYNLVKSKN